MAKVISWTNYRHLVVTHWISLMDDRLGTDVRCKRKLWTQLFTGDTPNCLVISREVLLGFLHSYWSCDMWCQYSSRTMCIDTGVAFHVSGIWVFHYISITADPFVHRAPCVVRTLNALVHHDNTALKHLAPFVGNVFLENWRLTAYVVHLRFPTDGFPSNLILEVCMKICDRPQIWSKSGKSSNFTRLPKNI
jgi:hypothetical protein